MCEDTEDENEVLRAAPTRDVPFTADLDIVEVGIDLGSPALSTRVLRLGSGSPSKGREVSTSRQR